MGIDRKEVEVGECKRKWVSEKPPSVRCLDWLGIYTKRDE